MAKFELGQRVYISTYGRGFSEATVTKVGRKYVTADGYQFVIGGHTLRSGYAGSILTEQEWTESVRRNELWRELREVGLEERMGHGRKLTNDQLERILAIANESKVTQNHDDAPTGGGRVR